MNKKVSEHYVNNKEFTAAVANFNEAVKLAESKGEKPPRMPEYIGECIYKISTRLSTRPNFINYTYRDEMICDAIENCIQYIRNFNIEKSNNAFAYITQICYYAFLRRIQKEKKQMYVKYKLIEEIDKEHLFPRWVEENEGVDTAESKNATADYYKLTEADIDKFIPKKEREKRERLKNKGITLDAFLKDEISENSTDK